MMRNILFISALVITFFHFGLFELLADAPSASGGFWDTVTSADTDSVKNLATTHLWFALLVCFVSGILNPFSIVNACLRSKFSTTFAFLANSRGPIFTLLVNFPSFNILK